MSSGFENEFKCVSWVAGKAFFVELVAKSEGPSNYEFTVSL